MSCYGHACAGDASGEREDKLLHSVHRRTEPRTAEEVGQHHQEK